MPVREAFRSFFYSILLKQHLQWEIHSIDRQNRSIFSKIRAFFSFVFIKAGSTPPRYLHPIVTQEIHTIHCLLFVQLVFHFPVIKIHLFLV